MKRLLLVEDEPGLVLTLRDRLIREGYAIETSIDGESGLERASREAFDLVLLDVMTVLSKDITSIPEDEIPTAHVSYTIVGGKVAYRK